MSATAGLKEVADEFEKPGTSRLEHALIRSVSEEVLHRANRTVLVAGGHPEGSGERS